MTDSLILDILSHLNFQNVDNKVKISTREAIKELSKFDIESLRQMSRYFDDNEISVIRADIFIWSVSFYESTVKVDEDTMINMDLLQIRYLLMQIGVPKDRVFRMVEYLKNCNRYSDFKDYIKFLKEMNLIE